MSFKDLYENLAVPYVFVMSAVEHDGAWMRRAEYPELPNCYVEALSALSAFEQLEQLRVRMIVEMHNRGEVPPRPRPPLKSGLPGIGEVDLDKLLASVMAEAIG